MKLNIMITEIQIMLKRKTFWFSFIFLLLFSILTTGYNLCKYWGLSYDDTASPYFMYILNDANSYSNILTTIFPFVIILPFAMSHAVDCSKNSHIFFLVSRCTRKEYFTAQAFVTFLGSFVIIVIPALLNIVLNYIVFAENTKCPGWGEMYTSNFLNSVTGVNADLQETHYGFYFKKLFLFHPMAHNVLFAMNAGVLAGVLAVFGYGCSFYFRKNRIYIFMPVFIVLQVLGMISAAMYLNVDKLRVYINLYILQYVLSGFFTNGKNYIVYYIFLIIISIISIGLILRKIQEEELK